MAWLPGPLPPETWNWGGVVLKGFTGGGFLFADFCGDHVITSPDGKRYEPDEIELYNNCLELPPGAESRTS